MAAMSFPVPENESGRLRAVASYAVYGTEPERAFDDIAALASMLTGCPLAAVTIIAETAKWMKARLGIPPEYAETPRTMSICAHTICQGDVLVVPDLREDGRFEEIPYVADEPHLRFYAGAPLINPEGYALGTLCVLDFQPHELDFDKTRALRQLARQVVAQLELRRKLAEVEEARQSLASAKEQADRLLLNVLPATIAEELERTGRVEPKYFPSATILFADFQEFTRFAEKLSPRHLVDDLDTYFSAFDDIVARHGLEKLKTIGDAYMCVGGLPRENSHHPLDACLAALEMIDSMARANAQRQAMRLESWGLRLGIHTGSVMAGVVGKTKFTYDIWGDAVNIAARMEEAGEPGRVNVSESTWRRVEPFFEGVPRGRIKTKNRREMDMFFLDRLKPEFASDPGGRTANEKLFQSREAAGHIWAPPRAKAGGLG
ncbi:MAG TPA: adenylate/guanylate cyclase domain-containing protein [Paracoccaceae bacterium]|nr:adenylate/guanylate cyclase domain-containing protein [Paracoccaceae bacterium]